jgi:hypothetical protein
LPKIVEVVDTAGMVSTHQPPGAVEVVQSMVGRGRGLEKVSGCRETEMADGRKRRFRV